MLPTDLEQMTFDQIILLWVDLQESQKISVDEALQRGLIEPGPTGVQMAIAEAERQKKQQARAARAARRARRNQQAAEA